MNYAATIASRLGVDTKPFSDGMTVAANTSQRAGDKIAQGMNRADAAHGNLLKSGSRVAHSISNVAREMASGADATQVFGSALEGLGRSLKLSLGTIAGFFVGGMIAMEIAKASKEMTKLHNEIARLGDTSDLNLEAFDKLSAKLTEVRKKMVELDQAYPKAGRYVTMGQIWNTISHPIDSIFGPDRDARTLRKSNRATMLAEAKRAKRDNDILEAHADGGGSPYELDHSARAAASNARAARMKAYDEMLPKVHAAFFDKNLALAGEALRAYAITLKEINEKERDVAEKRQHSIKESVQLSLGDLAKNGREWAPGFQMRAGAGRQARRAMQEEELARKAILAEHWDEALLHRNRAEQIKNGIGTLKDSEKDMASAVQRGNDASEILRQIRDNTAGPMVNR